MSLDCLDSPARIAIVGAGPIGLEAALYGRFLGFEVDVYERGSIVASLKRWAHVRMFTPFRLNRSSLGLAALAAQDSSWRAPPDDAMLTGRQFIDGYLAALAESDLLADRIFPKTEVLAIGKDGPRKGELAGREEREDQDFRLLLRDAEGRERVIAADAVIDASGTFGNHNWFGHGGIPAIGEIAAEAQIEYGLPDVLGSDRGKYAGRHTLLIGDGDSAATTVTALAELARSADDTRITWLTCRIPDEAVEGPVRQTNAVPLPARDELIQMANRLAKKSGKVVTHWPATSVEALTWSEKKQRFFVKLIGEHAGELEVDRIVANVGYRPDYRLSRELHVQQSAITESPLAQAIPQSNPSAENTVAPQHSGPERLLTSEPHFYVLGAKSYGRDARFLIADGLRQVRDLFKIIGDRASLDLYATIGKEPISDPGIL